MSTSGVNMVMPTYHRHEALKTARPAPRVEFCGIPGSGKSSICAETQQALCARGFPFLNRVELMEQGLRVRNFGLLANLLGSILPSWRRAVFGFPHAMNDWLEFAVKHGDFAALVHDWLRQEPLDEQWRTAVFHAVLTTAFEYQLFCSVAQPVLLDEGFAHRFFSLRGYRGASQPGDAARYAELMPVATAVILVETPSSICLTRLKQRSNLPLLFQHEEMSVVETRLSEGAELLSNLAHELEQGDTPVLRVSGSANMALEAERVVNFIQAQPGRQPN